MLAAYFLCFGYKRSVGMRIEYEFGNANAVLPELFLSFFKAVVRCFPIGVKVGVGDKGLRG